jgi:hypothetical protein
MTGIAIRWRSNSRWSSGPDAPGNPISGIRQLAWLIPPEARNSSADKIVLTTNPGFLSRSGSDFRTDSLSSTDTNNSFWMGLFVARPHTNDAESDPGRPLYFGIGISSLELPA